MAARPEDRRESIVVAPHGDLSARRAGFDADLPPAAARRHAIPETANQIRTNGGLVPLDRSKGVGIPSRLESSCARVRRARSR